ncbi:hypothetical protein ACJ41O_001641 [Fusarium nematophilum]
MRNVILRDKVEKAHQSFIDSIDNEAICRLASSYRNGTPCKTFDNPKHGSFNFCVFIEFDTSPPERWVVRIPLPARAVWIDERIETQLATMRYVAAKTTIPVPRDLGFKKGKRWRTYIRPTEATKKLHSQLADLYIQLRQLEFPAIGALGLPIIDGKPSYDCSADDIRVCHRPLSIEVAMQELEGMDPGSRIKPNTTFPTARSFIDALFWFTENEFDKSPDPGLDKRGGRNSLYARHHFRRFVLDTWLDSTADKGPFVLMHGDVLMLMSKLLFDDDLNLYRRLVAVIEDRERVLRAPPGLSREWAKTEEARCDTAVVMALLSLDLTYSVFWDLIFYATEEKSDDPDFKKFYMKAIHPGAESFASS